MPSDFLEGLNPIAHCSNCGGPIGPGEPVFAYEAEGGEIRYVHYFRHTCATEPSRA